MASSAQDRTWFAWDCFRRYLQCSAMAQGMARDEFDAIMAAMKGQVFPAPETELLRSSDERVRPGLQGLYPLQRGSHGGRPPPPIGDGRVGRSGFVELPESQNLPQDNGDQRRLGHGRDYPGHGFRQPFPGIRLRGVLHPQPPLVRRPVPALGRFHPGQPGARTWSRAWSKPDR